MSDWDDWRYALALARDGSATGAAKTLGVDPTTVLRHIGSLETRLKVSLFERQGYGYRMTDEGQRLAEAADSMESLITKFEKSVGVKRPLRGQLRIVTTEDLMAGLLDPYFARLQRSQPELRLDLIIDGDARSLSRYEADVAVRTLPPKDREGETGRRLHKVAWSCYVSEGYLREKGSLFRPTQLAEHRVFRPRNRPPVVGWLNSIGVTGEPCAESNSLFSLRQLALAGLGVAVLPCYVGEHGGDLVRTFTPIYALTQRLWVVMNKDVQKTARVRAFLRRLENITEEDRIRLEGQGPARRRTRQN